MEKKYVMLLGDGSTRVPSEHEIKQMEQVNARGSSKFIYSLGNYRFINIAEVDSYRLISLYQSKKSSMFFSLYEKILGGFIVGIAIFVLITFFNVNSLGTKLSNVKATIDNFDFKDKVIDSSAKKTNDQNIQKAKSF